MFSAPKLHHIDLLHGIGNELGALKRHYKSYIRLVDRVTEPQSSTLASRTGSRVPSKASQETFDKLAVQGAQSLMGVGLTSAAIIRFERLRDMISLYALAECKDYLHQKDGLVQMVSATCHLAVSHQLLTYLNRTSNSWPCRSLLVSIALRGLRCSSAKPPSCSFHSLS